jgi:hypothetical protein
MHALILRLHVHRHKQGKHIGKSHKTLKEIKANRHNTNRFFPDPLHTLS